MKKMKTLLIDDNKAFVILARHLLACRSLATRLSAC